VPTGIVKILSAHAHTVNAYTVAHHRNCQIQMYPVNCPKLAARPTPVPQLFAARPTLGLGFDAILAASSTMPHPWSSSTTIRDHAPPSDTMLILFSINPHPWNYTHTIALTHTQLAHTIGDHINSKEVKRRHRRQHRCYCL
jgi:hypothetical protein